MNISVRLRDKPLKMIFIGIICIQIKVDSHSVAIRLFSFLILLKNSHIVYKHTLGKRRRRIRGTGPVAANSYIEDEKG